VHTHAHTRTSYQPTEAAVRETGKLQAGTQTDRQSSWAEPHVEAGLLLHDHRGWALQGSLFWRWSIPVYAQEDWPGDYGVRVRDSEP
jgi:hypothetical protein